MKWRDETIYDTKQIYQERIREQATLLKDLHTSWTPLLMVNDWQWYHNQYIWYHIYTWYDTAYDFRNDILILDQYFIELCHQQWSRDGKGPSVSDLSVLLRWHRDYERDPAKCVLSVRRHWLHPHPVVASLVTLPKFGKLSYMSSMTSYKIYDITL